MISSFYQIGAPLTESRDYIESYFSNLNKGNLIPVLFLESLRGLLSGFIQKYLPSPDATEISSLNSHSSVLSIALIPGPLCREYSLT